MARKGRGAGQFADVTYPGMKVDRHCCRSGAQDTQGMWRKGCLIGQRGEVAMTTEEPSQWEMRALGDSPAWPSPGTWGKKDD